MVEYKCYRCGKNFKKKINYEYHKKRKFRCVKKEIKKKFRAVRILNATFYIL